MAWPPRRKEKRTGRTPRRRRQPVERVSASLEPLQIYARSGEATEPGIVGTHHNAATTFNGFGPQCVDALVNLGVQAGDGSLVEGPFTSFLASSLAAVPHSLCTFLGFLVVRSGRVSSHLSFSLSPFGRCFRLVCASVFVGSSAPLSIHLTSLLSADHELMNSFIGCFPVHLLVLCPERLISTDVFKKH